jgi:hypothetical protein
MSSSSAAGKAKAVQVGPSESAGNTLEGYGVLGSKLEAALKYQGEHVPYEPGIVPTLSKLHIERYVADYKLLKKLHDKASDEHKALNLEDFRKLPHVVSQCKLESNRRPLPNDTVSGMKRKYNEFYAKRMANMEAGIGHAVSGANKAQASAAEAQATAMEAKKIASNALQLVEQQQQQIDTTKSKVDDLDEKMEMIVGMGLPGVDLQRAKAALEKSDFNVEHAVNHLLEAQEEAKVANAAKKPKQSSKPQKSLRVRGGGGPAPRVVGRKEE